MLKFAASAPRFDPPTPSSASFLRPSTNAAPATASGCYLRLLLVRLDKDFASRVGTSPVKTTWGAVKSLRRVYSLGRSVLHAALLAVLLFLTMVRPAVGVHHHRSHGRASVTNLTRRASRPTAGGDQTPPLRNDVRPLCLGGWAAASTVPAGLILRLYRRPFIPAGFRRLKLPSSQSVPL